MKTAGYRRRRQIARQRRKERDRLRQIAVMEAVARVLSDPPIDPMDTWVNRGLQRRPSADERELLMLHGFPLHAGLRGEALREYRATRRYQRALIESIDISPPTHRRACGAAPRCVCQSARHGVEN